MSIDDRTAAGSALRKVFKKYAIENEQGQLVIPSVVFVRDFLRWDVNDDAVMLVASVADIGRTGSITLDEFMAVERIMRMPDAHFRLAFRMCDKHGKGTISVDDFMGVMQVTQAYKEVKFNKTCSWMQLHFGRNLQRRMRPDEFPQFIASVPREHVRQAFRCLIKDSTDGSIDAIAYTQAFSRLKGPSFTKYLKDNLLGVVTAQTTRISYSYFTALNALLHNIELIKQIFSDVVDKLEEKEITKDQFDAAAWRFSEAITPVQTMLLWRLLDHDNTGKISLKDFHLLIPAMTVSKETKSKKEDDKTGSWGQTAKVGMYRFCLSSIGGATGAATVYPIDLVKTRLQNQVTTIAEEVLYKNSADCFKKVLKFEGVRGLYRGLLPQLCGVAPEKAIKMTTNDFVRDHFTDPKSGTISLPAEIMAGGMGGCAQVVFTNPIEIVKIRLQIAGEMAASAHKVTALSVAWELGIRGLYRGARACVLRDAPFSAIYFPTYAHLKGACTNEETGEAPFWGILGSATLAGVPAASLVTPADVVKTRLQVKPRPGMEPYTGLTNCARRLYAEEGFSVFWKGAPARMFRSAPQFGVTLAVYEMLQRAIGYGPAKKTPPKVAKIGSYVPHDDYADHIGGYSNTQRTFANLEQKLGLWFPSSGNNISTQILRSVEAGELKVVTTEGTYQPG